MGLITHSAAERVSLRGALVATSSPCSLRSCRFISRLVPAAERALRRGILAATQAYRRARSSWHPFAPGWLAIYGSCRFACQPASRRKTLRNGAPRPHDGGQTRWFCPADSMRANPCVGHFAIASQRGTAPQRAARPLRRRSPLSFGSNMPHSHRFRTL